MALNQKGIEHILAVGKTIASEEATTVYPKGMLVVDSSNNIRVGDGSTAGGTGIAGASGYANTDVDAHLNTGTATANQVLSWTGTDYDWVAQSGGGGGGISSTDDVPEGSSNLYYTDARADTRATLRIGAASIGNLNDVDTTGASDGQALAWSSSNSRWEPLTISGGSYSNSDVDTHLNQSNPTAGYVLSWNGSDYAWTANGTGSGLGDVVDDTTPQLGGTLETNGNLIQFGDSASATDDRLQFGANQDLHIYHDSNFNNNVIDGISGHLIVRNEPSNTTNNVYVQADNEVLITTISAQETMAKFSKDGGVELYYDDHKKLETASHGISVVNEAHIEGATPYLTLKRTDNANVPMIRFLGSGGAAGSTIGFDGTSGTVNEMIFQTYDGSLNERLRVQTGGVKITGSFALGTSGTEPTSSGDAGEVGEVRYTDNYIYIKTSAGWKRANLSGIV